MILSAPLTVESTVRLPVIYDENSIFLDIKKDPKAASIVLQVMKANMGGLMTDPSEGTEAAQEAISEEMNTAMMDYMPLRTLISFSGGQLDHEGLGKILEQMNG